MIQPRKRRRTPSNEESTVRGGSAFHRSHCFNDGLRTRLAALRGEAAVRLGGAIPAEVHGHLTSLDGGAGTGDRVVAVQTPQAFAAGPLLEAYRRADLDGFVGTDTASCIERYADITVHWVPGDARNIKITFPDDLFIAERLLAKARWDLTARGRTR